jgi:hypothetical protein
MTVLASISPLALPSCRSHAEGGGTVSSQRWTPGVPIEVWVREEDVERAKEMLGPEERFSQ